MKEKQPPQWVIDRYGSYQAYREALAERGRKGGAATSGGGFAHGKLDPKIIGQKGGSAKRRKKNV